MSRPLKIQIIERARTLILDEQHWCRHHLAEVNGVSVSPTSPSAVKRCALGALIAAAYQLTHDLDEAYHLGHEALRPRYGPSTVIYTNDVRGHAAVLALFDEVIAACNEHRLAFPKSPAGDARGKRLLTGLATLYRT